MQQRLSVFPILLLFVFQYNVTLFAQKDTTSSGDKPTLSLGTEYTSNNNAFGNVNSYVSQPTYKSSVSYKTKKGFELIFSPIFVGNSDSTNTKFTSEYDLGATYTLNAGKVFSITPAFTHYWYSQSSTTLNSGFSNNATLTSSLSVKWWGTSVAVGYGWGQTRDFTIAPTTNATIDINNFLGADNTLEIQPTAGLTLNRNELKNLNDSKKLKGLDEFIKLHPTLTVSDFLTSTDPAIVTWRTDHPAVVSSITKKYQKMQSKGSGKKEKTSVILADLLAPKSKFGIASINLSLPISYSIKNFTISGNFQYNIPNNKTDPEEFYMSCGITYSFGL